MAHHHEHHHHDHDEEGESTFGMAFGFRTVEQDGSLYLVEAEVSPYVDEPGELGATLVFHALEWIDPEHDEDAEIPAWVIEIDDDLTRRGSDPVSAQFTAIVRQLHDLSTARLLEYLTEAKEAAEEE